MTLDSISLADFPELAAYVGPGATPQQRMMAAKGLAPLVPAQLATLLFLLAQDEDAGLAAEARKSFAALPESIRAGIAQDPKSHPAVLHFLAMEGGLPRPALEKLLLNPSTDDRTFAWLAKHSADPVILEVISNNQVRLSRMPIIATLLIDNDKMGLSHAERLRGYIEEEAREKARAAGAPLEEAEAVPPPAAPAPEKADSPKAEGMVSISAMWRSTESDVQDGYQSFVGDDLIDDTNEGAAAEEEGGSITNMYKHILGLKTSQKIKLAFTGNKEARSLLVKESNKMISTAVLKNPRITDGEIVAISQSRSIAEDVLRIIGSDKEHLKNYAVKLGLASNPKTPLPMAMRLIGFLTKNDVANLSKNKNVSGSVQTAARRRLQSMTKEH